jgi:hypothetical protein
MWWNITFTNGRSVTVSIGRKQNPFFGRMGIEKEGRTFHYREQYLSHEPELISETFDLHSPLDGKFMLIIHRKNVAQTK